MNETTTLKRTEDIARRKFLAATYGWMVVALLISAVSAFAVAGSIGLQRIIFGGRFTFMALIIAEFALVFFLSARIRSMSKTAAAVSFIVYSIINGLTLSSVLLVYKLGSIAHVFVIAAVMFGGMSLYAVKTKSNLMSAGRYLFMGLIGLLVASIVNMFLRSSAFDWIISLLGVVLFTGLTAYDTQKILKISAGADGSESYAKVAIIAALELYLDFINLFLYLLRLFGKKD